MLFGVCCGGVGYDVYKVGCGMLGIVMRVGGVGVGE